MEFQLAPPANRYLFKVNNRNIKKSWEICPKLTIKTTERHQQRPLCFLIVNFGRSSHSFLVFVLLTSNK